jgi:hypothetical protein
MSTLSLFECLRWLPAARPCPAAYCWAVLALLLGSGCPRQVSEESGKEQFGPCTSLGQRCQFSPGKLGSCVQIDNCKSGSCFVCQSQH